MITLRCLWIMTFKSVRRFAGLGVIAALLLAGCTGPQDPTPAPSQPSGLPAPKDFLQDSYDEQTRSILEDILEDGGWAYKWVDDLGESQEFSLGVHAEEISRIPNTGPHDTTLSPWTGTLSADGRVVVQVGVPIGEQSDRASALDPESGELSVEPGDGEFEVRHTIYRNYLVDRDPAGNETFLLDEEAPVKSADVYVYPNSGLDAVVRAGEGFIYEYYEYGVSPGWKLVSSDPEVGVFAQSSDLAEAYRFSAFQWGRDLAIAGEWGMKSLLKESAEDRYIDRLPEEKDSLLMLVDTSGRSKPVVLGDGEYLAADGEAFYLMHYSAEHQYSQLKTFNPGTSGTPDLTQLPGLLTIPRNSGLMTGALVADAGQVALTVYDLGGYQAPDNFQYETTFILILDIASKQAQILTLKNQTSQLQVHFSGGRLLWVNPSIIDTEFGATIDTGYGKIKANIWNLKTDELFHVDTNWNYRGIDMNKDFLLMPSPSTSSPPPQGSPEFDDWFAEASSYTLARWHQR